MKVYVVTNGSLCDNCGVEDVDAAFSADTTAGAYAARTGGKVHALELDEEVRDVYSVVVGTGQPTVSRRPGRAVPPAYVWPNDLTPAGATGYGWTREEAEAAARSALDKAEQANLVRGVVAFQHGLPAEPCLCPPGDEVPYELCPRHGRRS